MKINKYKVDVISTTTEKRHCKFQFELTIDGEMPIVEIEIEKHIRARLIRNHYDDFSKITFEEGERYPEYGYMYIEAIIE